MADDPSDDGPSPALIAAMTGASDSSTPAPMDAPADMPALDDSSDGPSPQLIAAMTPAAPATAPKSSPQPQTLHPHLQPSRFVQAGTPPIVPSHGQPSPEPSWGDVAQSAVHNLGSSGAQAISGMWNAVSHPVQTLQNLGQLAAGAGSQIAGAVGVQQNPQQKAQNERMIDALESHYQHAYFSGSKGLKQAVSTDPVGVLMDASMVADPAAGALGKLGAAGKLGVVSDAATAVSRALPYVNPVRSALAIARAPGAALSAVARGAGSVTSRVPLSALKLATQAGVSASPDVQAAFSRFATGQGDATEFAQNAQKVLGQIKQDASDNYLAGKSQLLDQPVPLQNTYTALGNADTDLDMGAAGGWPEAKQAMAATRSLVDDFSAKNDPASQNIANADALKQQIYNLHDSFSNPKASQYIDHVYHGVKADIADVDPAYSDLMETYQSGRNNINDLTKTLGLGRNAAATATLAKSLRALKTGTGSNLLQQLMDKDPSLGGALAGAAVNPWSQSGSLWEAALGAGLPAALAHPLGAAALLPGAVAGFAASSPRIVGSAANLAGKASRNLDLLASPTGQNIAKGVYYGSRPNDVQDNQDTSEPSSPIAATPNDTDAATRMVLGEAGNQSDTGKTAALYTAINRARMSGKSLSDVISQPNAYEAVTSGKTNAIDPSSPLYQYVHDNIVLPALSGQLEDPTGGMTHFINKTLQRAAGRKIPDWAQGQGLQIGDHTFYAAGGRVGRASGGRTHLSEEQLVQRLMDAAESAKKEGNKITKPLLSVPDNAVAKALSLTNQAA